MMRASFTVATLVVALAQSATAASDPLPDPGKVRPVFAPPADWVKTADIPAAEPPGAGALQILLQDQQVRFGATEDDVYRELALKILDPVGLSKAGNLPFAWNPETQTLILHHARILRGDKVIDLLARPDAVTVIRRETNLELAMLDGALTAIIQPEGLQAGDILDIAVTLSDHDPVLHGMSESFLEAPIGAPAQRFRIRATWDSAKPMQWRIPAPLGDADIRHAGGTVEWVMERHDFEAPHPPTEAPERFQHPGRVSFTEYHGWDQAAALMAPLYNSAATLNPASPIRAEIVRIAAQSSDPKVRAAAALHLVQQQVRYLALNLGIGGLKPASADLTWMRRFGDCKGKSVLLVAILRGLGIEADPALVSTRGGDSLGAGLPKLGGFDHVIVRARIGGKTYWLDGTRLGDRNLDDLQPPGFRWALPLLAERSTLVKIDEAPPGSPLEEVEMRIDMSAGPDVEAPTRVQFIYRGDPGIAAHLGYSASPAADLDRGLREMFAKSYPWVTVRSVGADWDDALGVMRLRLDGSANIPWAPYAGGRQFFVPGAELGGEVSFNREPGPDKDAPFAVAFPLYAATRTTVVLPAKTANFTLEGAGDYDRVIGGTAYHRRAILTDGVATVETSTKSLRTEFPAAEATAAAAELQALGARSLWINAPAAAGPASSGAAAVPVPEPTTAVDFARRGVSYLVSHQDDRAIADLTRSAQLDPKVARTFYNRAVGYADKGDFLHARADLDTALGLAPNQASFLTSRARVRLALGEVTGAEADFDAAIAAAPGASGPIWQAALAMSEADRFENAIVYLDRLNAQFPSDPHIADFLNARCWSRATWNRDLDAAMVDCESAVKIDPKRADFLDSRALVELRLGHMDAARRDYDAALASRPDRATSLYGRGLTRQHAGDAAGASADIAAAMQIDKTISRRFAAWGLGEHHAP
jgi:tetratricopeptide (TPR) repeat protein